MVTKTVLCDADISIRPFYVYIYIYPCPLLLKCIPGYIDTHLITDIVCNATMVKNITIVSGPAKDKEWILTEISKKVGVMQWHEVDLRTILKKDHSATIGHKEDYRVERTQQVVIGQEGFPELVNDCVKFADTVEHVWLNCNTGWHRASVTGKVLESQLNSLVDIDAERMYNTMHIMFHECTSSKMWHEKIGDVVAWLTAPWMIETEYNGTRRSLFGYAASMRKANSAHNWNVMFETISSCYRRGDTRDSFTEMDSSSTPWDHDSVMQRNEQSSTRANSVVSSSASSANAPSFTMPPKPPPAATQPSAKAAVSSRQPHDCAKGGPCQPPTAPSARAYAEQGRGDRACEEHPSHHERDPSSESDEAYANRMCADQYWQEQDYGSAEGEQEPDWATFERDPRVWWEILDWWHIDHDARAQLFSLAQHSDKGHEEANELIGKLLKKKADKTEFRSNASAFIYSSVLYARAHIAKGGGDDRPSKRARSR